MSRLPGGQRGVFSIPPAQFVGVGSFSLLEVSLAALQVDLPLLCRLVLAIESLFLLRNAPFCAFQFVTAVSNLRFCLAAEARSFISGLNE
jgi:hypothetical protein